MQNEPDQSEPLTNNKPPQVWRGGIASVIAYAIPIAAYFSLVWFITTILAFKMPLAAAIPLGLAIAAVVFYIHAQSQGGSRTVVELNCSSIIVIALTLLLTPVFIKAHERAIRRQNRHRPDVAKSNRASRILTRKTQIEM